MITVEDLGQVLDRVSPLTLRGATTHYDDAGTVWFAHPDWDHVFCKLGRTTAGRWLAIWVWLDEREEPVVAVLTVRDATPDERHFLGHA